MIATIIYILGILVVPKVFKNTGIAYVVQNKVQGVWLILLSKTIWWMTVLNLFIYWFPHYQTYAIYVCIVGMTYGMLKEKKYIIFEFNQFAKNN